MSLRLINVYFPETFEPFEQCAKIAMKDDRMVLTSGARHYVTLKGLVDNGRCLRMISDKPAEQVKRIASNFNLLVANVFFILVRR